MNIPRTGLIKELTAFALGGSGVIIGSPGVGKSFALLELRKNFKSQGIPHLILAVERLGRGTPLEVTSVLRRDGDFVDLLKSAATGFDQKGVLMFDGFDAARGESEQLGILRLIQRAVVELKGHWNVLVSVRTFDAMKSDRLARLFPTGTKIARGSMLPKCRNFLIPPLTSDEVNIALSQTSTGESVSVQASSDLRSLLTIPFNIWLVEQIVSAGSPQHELSGIVSEVQLLDLFWRYRVTKREQAANREFILRRLVARMVETHELTVNRGEIYEPSFQAEWDGLFSDGVLYEATDLQVRVGFSHNILFDYAVTVLLLDSNPTAFANFLGEDTARPLFLRPSLVYHFTRLWHFDRVQFWVNFWEALRQESIHVRQIIRLVLPAVVLNEARLVNDLEPVLSALAGRENTSGQATLYLFQAIRSLKTTRTQLWSAFLRGCAGHITRAFAWEGGLVAKEIADLKPQVPSIISDCGEYGRALMRWAFVEREQRDRAWFDRMIAIVGIPLTAKSYSSSPEQSKLLLKRVFAFMDEPGFSIDCFFWLAQQVDDLIAVDPIFVGEIYEAIFGHREVSEDKTSMGGGTVVNLISTRRQDFDGCQYSLLTAFDKFLAEQPLIAIGAGIRALQSFAHIRHVAPYASGTDLAREETKDVRFRGKDLAIVEDGSAIWDRASYHPDRELAIVDSCFTWLESAAAGGKSSEVDSFLDIIAKDARMAFLWNRLFRVGANQPAVFSERLFDLVVNRSFIILPSVRREVDRFVHHAVRLWSQEECLQFENTVLALATDASNAGNDRLINIRNRLILQLPRELLVTTQGIALQEEQLALRAGAETEEEFTARVISRPYSEDDSLKAQGVDLDSTANKALRKKIEELKVWTAQDDSGTPLDEMVKDARFLTEQLLRGGEAHLVISDLAWEQVTSFAMKAAGEDCSPDSDNFRSLEFVLLEASKRNKPELDEYAKKWKSAVWSPAPRNDAAQGISRLLAKSATPGLLEAAERLAKDPVPSVRFLLVSELWRLRETAPDLMWRLIESCVAHEENTVVLLGLTTSLWNTRGKEGTPHLNILRMLYERTETQKLEDEEFIKSVVYMIVDYAVREEDKWADSLVARWRSNPIAYAPFISQSGHRLIQYIKPRLSSRLLLPARSLLIAHLDAVATGLVQLQTKAVTIPKDKETPVWRALYGVIDESITRIYFACDVSTRLRKGDEEPLNEEERNTFFREAIPILDKILSFGMSGETGMLLAPTAHYFMQLLHGMLAYDPARMLRMATDVVTSSKRFGFNIDSIAMSDTVKLVESVLADYRPNIQNPESLTDLMNLLDAFVEVGWPEALNLVWRLDEVYR